MSQSPVVVGTDLSDASFSAIRVAAAWAERHQLPLVVAHISSGIGVSPANDTKLREAIGKLVAELVATPTELVLRQGSAHAELLRLADELGAGLLVVGASGAGALKQAIFGSTAASVARYAHCPVMVARPSPESGPVVVGTDFSEAVTPALVLGGNEAKRREVPLVLLHSNYEPSSPLNLLGPIVVSPPRPSDEDVEARRQAARTTLESLMSAHGGPGECVVADTEPASALVAEAERRGANLLVVGTHGRTGFTRIALGSVAEAVAARASCSVLIARDQA